MTYGLYLDRYELAMAWAYWREGRHEEAAVFDYFFRTLPYQGGYAIFAGLGTLLETLKDFRFDPEQLRFLEADGFEKPFLDYLRNFRFRGSIWAPEEGEVIFPVEPVLRVEAGLVEAQLVETLLLNVLNFQSLIATKAARCLHFAQGRSVSEFGMRRAQGLGCLWASRAAYIGGCGSTSNMEAAYSFGIPPAGTMAHAFIQSYDDELVAFRKFADVHGSKTILLLDTYDTLQSGLPHAIQVAHELRARGQSLLGVRLDSGDLGYLSRKVREQLDNADLRNVKIVASNQLDEAVIRSLLEQGAAIDIFGVGTSLATGAPDAALDGVYKLSQTLDTARIKASEAVAKSTLPGRKVVWRYEDPDGMLMADAIALADESAPTEMLHPYEPVQQLNLSGWTAYPLLAPVMKEGEALQQPSIHDAARHAREQIKKLPPEHLRIENPHVYKVGLSPSLRRLRDELLLAKRKEIKR